MTKIAVILIGAGGPFAWSGPSTSNITNKLFESEEFLTTAGQNLAEYIRDCHASFHNCPKSSIHFEYIINDLESIASYMEDEIKGGPPNLRGSKPVWFNLNELYLAIENFRYVDGLNGKGMLINNANTSIPYGVQKDSYRRSYILKALEHYLLTIQRAISTYDNKESILN
jgi:hypothetical protein